MILRVVLGSWAERVMVREATFLLGAVEEKAEWAVVASRNLVCHPLVVRQS